jgi:3-oxoacyl-[acyl-carrier protein] reductase
MDFSRHHFGILTARCPLTTFALMNVLQRTVARLGQPRDIAAAVCFTSSPLNDFMTGTTFRIDGGATPTV